MKFKSIQFSVAALAGAIVLSVVAALVLYALFSGARTQQMVQDRTQAQFEQVIEQRLSGLAQTQVSQIQRELEAPLLIAGGLVRVNALMGTQDSQGHAGLSLSREQLIALIKENVTQNPKILGAYIGWEPGAIDHDDAAYVGTSVVGIDAANGRFLPGGSAMKTAAWAWTNWPTSMIGPCFPPACAPASTTSAPRTA